MPITISYPVTYTIAKINVDMTGSMWCLFQRHVNGLPDGNVEFTIEGADFAVLLATQATAGQPLADEITLAIYNYAVAHGLVAGTVS